MNYNRKDVITGFIIVLVIVLGVFLYKKFKTPKPLPSPTPKSIDFKKEFENNFKFDIPDEVNVVELKDISGGNGRGIATPSEVLADIEDPAPGFFYEAWLQDPNTQKLISLGKLRVAKGGWLIEYNASKYPEYKKIVISLEKRFDNILEKAILEGSF